MGNSKLKTTVITALLTALNIVISRILIIPIPFTHGNINLCDAGIFIVALLYGPWAGLFTGALSGFVLDLISGYSQYMFFSLLIHGLEGRIVGKIAQKENIKFQWRIVSAMIMGVIIMVSGYFCADSILYNISVGALAIPINCIQGIAGIIVAWIIVPILKRTIKLL